MAALATSAVSFYPTGSGSDLYVSHDQTVVTRRLKLVLTGQGDLTEPITAAILGFSKLISCSNLVDTANAKIYLAGIDPVANALVFAATASDSNADVTSTAAYITVTGNPALAR